MIRRVDGVYTMHVSFVVVTHSLCVVSCRVLCAVGGSSFAGEGPCVVCIASFGMLCSTAVVNHASFSACCLAFAIHYLAFIVCHLQVFVIEHHAVELCVVYDKVKCVAVRQD